MAHVIPPRAVFRYRVSTNPDGTPYIGRYEDGGVYYNIISVRPGVSNPVRIIARCPTLDAADALVTALDRYTVRETS